MILSDTAKYEERDEDMPQYESVTKLSKIQYKREYFLTMEAFMLNHFKFNLSMWLNIPLFHCAFSCIVFALFQFYTLFN